jgi:hypothetical protein
VAPFGARDAWLSLTPEPEGELPTALATLRAGGAPPPALVQSERARAELLVTHGRRRAWREYLGEARTLALGAEDGGAVGEARALVLDVLDNHDQLTLGLPRTRRPGGFR